MKNIVLKNTLFLSIKPVLSLVIGILFSGYIGRHLGVARYGNLSYSMSFVTMFSFIANFGINTVLRRESSYAGANINELFINSVYLKLFLSLLTITSIIIMSLVMRTDNVLFIINVILAFHVILLSLQNTASSVFIGLKDMKSIAIVDFIVILLDVVVIVTIFWFGGHETGIAGGKIFSALVGLILLFLLLNRMIKIKWVPFNQGVAKKLLKSGFYITIITMIYPLYYQIGPVILGTIYGAKTVGVYQAASGLVEKLLIFSIPISDAIFPNIAASKVTLGDATSEVDFHYFLKTIILLAIIAWVGTYFFGPVLISILFGSEYAPSQHIVKILAIPVGLRFINTFGATILLAKKYERPSSLMVSVQCAIQIVLCIVFIPYYGTSGVAYSFLAAEAAGVIMQGFYIGKMERINGVDMLHRYKKIIWLVIFFAGIIITGEYVGLNNVQIFILFPIFPLLIIIFKIVRWTDIVNIWHIVFSKKVYRVN